MDWKAKAVAAYEGRESKQAARQKSAPGAALAKRVSELLGVEVEPQGDRVTVDGVTFRLGPYVGTSVGTKVVGGSPLQVVVVCPECSLETVGHGHDWDDLGQAIKDVPFKHDCYADTKEGRFIKGLLTKILEPKAPQ